MQCYDFGPVFKNRIPTFKIPDPDLCYFVFLRIHNPNPKQKKTQWQKRFSIRRDPDPQH